MQLLLPIHQIDDETLDSFYSENSLLLLDSLRQNFIDVQQPFFYIWGAKSCGKSHLLKAVSNQYLLSQKTASYIPLTKSHYFSPLVLDNIEKMDVICLDDLQAIANNEEWELAIFDLFNKIREQQSLFNQGHKTLLLISADCSPHQLKIKLPDLKSRLTWGEVYQLYDLTDDQKIVILQRKAYQKGIELSEEVANFLLKRLDRDLPVLLAELDKLDRASLQAKRKLTMPFVKEILGL
ncbi:DnaA regulatory inactivator Hda [[Haemophilus] ducreyi]|uniref:DnaA regulatory inactivator Hda n=1 Tax=Haemophilus ducreyi TaxID=730 RepID=UPI0006557EF5|nr:DnaA regulatory inactivator Hda [[Haemophilus] ducreyi]AKO45224.1 DNA replication protein [[Haemophilus] ducreyi]AKO46626.1 DNA replication protein [[Haemophilus] ducreyi]AKO47967.1 DNA replication protein [[Haemophilus] ducreyi]AKO49355.1 DNA replication protein [[Haemophilus] ducreyi]ANF61607.1 DnaA regulatory inactivator Hda [[Haemophilus] ducreyi]